MWYSSETCFNTPSTVGFVSMQDFLPAACGRYCIGSQLLKSEKSAFQKGQSISSRRELRRRRLAWILLVGYGLVASGLPLPVGVSTHAAAHTPAGKRLAVKDRSRPFPCMDKPCGCASAEQCFANCCCSTPRERLAWARSHRVEPAVVASLERLNSHETPQLESLQKSCCIDKNTIAPQPFENVCFEIVSEDSFAGCAHDQKSIENLENRLNPDGSQTKDSTDEQSRSSTTVNLQAMLACGGIAGQWIATGALLLPRIVSLSVVATNPWIAVILSNEAAFSPAYAPALPPPRLSFLFA